MMDWKKQLMTLAKCFRECREEWTRRSGLANAAPTMTPATVAELGYTGLTPTGQQILDGSYSSPASTDPETSNLLKNFYKTIPDPPGWYPPSNTLSATEYRQSVKANSHCTAAGPDGITSTMIRARTWSNTLEEIDRVAAKFP